MLFAEVTMLFADTPQVKYILGFFCHFCLEPVLFMASFIMFYIITWLYFLTIL